MQNKKEKLLIIDGNALIHRSFHALPLTIATKKGEITNAVYGFTTVLIKALREFKPSYVVLTLDKKAPTFRHKEFAEYKAHREKAPDELYKQIPRIKEIAHAFNIPIYEKDGFEADDLIGTISKEIRFPKTEVELLSAKADRSSTSVFGNRISTIIVTGDLDTLQLINNHTKVYTMSRGLSDSVIYDEKAVQNRFGGLNSKQMIDYKALRGDPSDNIPGVRGIGEKTAIELLKQFGNLENVYKYLDNRQQIADSSKLLIKSRIVELLKKHKDDAYLSKKLATIKCDVDIEFDLEKTKFGDFDKSKVVQLFSELEFKSLLPRIQGIRNNESGIMNQKLEFENKFARNKKQFNYILVDDDEKFELFFNELKKQKEFTFDTEATSVDPFTAELMGISFSWKEGEAYYVETKFPKTAPPQFATANWGGAVFGNLVSLKPIFEDEKIKKFAHNAKYDIRVMQQQGINVQGVAFDTMIASYLLNPGTRKHNLDALTFSELGFEKISKENLLGKGKNKVAFKDAEIEKLYLYSCEDADFTNKLVAKLRKKIVEQNMKKLFYEIEMPLVYVLAEMENNGIMLDKKLLNKMHTKISVIIAELENKIYHQAGIKFNINSPKQLQEILFEKLQISTNNIKKTKTGISTAADELVKLKDLHKIIPLIQEYRELTKLLNTYIDALPKLINPKTNRLHTSFNQAVTATGRLSSSDPNLQNIPARTKIGQEIRKAFIAESGYKLVSLDYSQIELRLVAHMAGDTKMIRAFCNGEDIHTATAAEINQVSLTAVTSEMRRAAKAVNFGILYGQGPHGLAQGAGISYVEAKNFIDQYFAVFAGIKKFIDFTIQIARNAGYVETLFNRKRYLPDLNASTVMIR
ncbi:DNA polymerase I, partial [Patescibacteria group bacterium]|nr:DNA polymerase I [Patescibacteria group bacterium]